MNYRHAYHAGNFADVMKHLTLTLLLDHFKKKDTPFCVIDAHGGIGLYDLKGEQALKTGEWEEGIGRFQDADTYGATSTDFALYADTVRPYLEKGLYPGSPLIAARNLRQQDRMIANELHPDDVETLSYSLRNFSNARVTHKDAYECIRANIPPKEKRGLVLIDPPFEKTDEFQTLIRQMQEWKKRFANGVFVIWYPIKAHLAVEDLKNASAQLGLHRTWCFETLKYPANQERTFNGSGLIVFNTPFMIPEKIESLSALLKEKMHLHAVKTSWLTTS